MFENLETFGALAAAVQNYAIAGAVIIGGIWTAWVFWFQRRSAVGIEIHVTQMEMPMRDNYHILITIKLENRGTRPTRLAWEDEPIAIAQLSVPAELDSSIQFVSTAAIRFIALNGKTKREVDTGLRPGDTKKYEVVMSVSLIPVSTKQRSWRKRTMSTSLAGRKQEVRWNGRLWGMWS